MERKSARNVEITPLTARFAVRPWFDTQNFPRTRRNGLARVRRHTFALGLNPELIAKSGGLKRVSTWLDGIGPPMLIAL